MTIGVAKLVVALFFVTSHLRLHCIFGFTPTSSPLLNHRSPSSLILRTSVGSKCSSIRRTFLNSFIFFQLLTSPVKAAFAVNTADTSSKSQTSTLGATAASSSAETGKCPENTASHRVLVIGANGQTGSRVIRLLHDDPQQVYKPIAMIRDASQASEFDKIGVPWIVGDLDAPSTPTVEDFEGIHTVIFAAGAGRSRPPLKKVTIDYLSAVRSVVASQESNSVKRFILLSGINSDPMGTRRSVDATDLSGPLSAWHRLKAHSETYLKESHLHGRPLDWIILCPGRLVDDENGKPGTSLIKVSLIHGEDDLKDALTTEEKKAAVRSLPGSHDGKVERLCVSRDNVAETLVGLLSAPNTIGKSITLVDGILPVNKALASI